MADPIYAQNMDEMAKVEQVASMSGLEFMRAILDGTLRAPNIARVLQYHLSEVEEGKVTFEGTPNFDALNPLGGVHGGWYGTLLDSCMACAVQTIQHVGRRTAVATGELRGKNDGKLYATGSTTCLIFDL